MGCSERGKDSSFLKKRSKTRVATHENQGNKSFLVLFFKKEHPTFVPPHLEKPMSDDNTVTLFHAPNSRSTGALVLLEELGAPYTLHVLNMKAGEQRQPAFLAVNPLGKVPAIRHRGVLVTEQVAIFIYLADQFPQAKLAPAIGESGRGTYLRWLVFYAACYEPGLVDKAMKRPPAPLAMSPYGSFDTVLETITGQLKQSPYLLGETMSAADILWGHALRWGVLFGLLPESQVITNYVALVTGRPSAAKAATIDAALAAEHEKALA
jgi:glutathione S-transferase